MARYSVTLAPELVVDSIRIAKWWRRNRRAAPLASSSSSSTPPWSISPTTPRSAAAPTAAASATPESSFLRRSGYLVFDQVDTAARRQSSFALCAAGGMGDSGIASRTPQEA